MPGPIALDVETARKPDHDRCERSPDVPVNKLKSDLAHQVDRSLLADGAEDIAGAVDQRQQRRARNDQEEQLARGAWFCVRGEQSAVRSLLLTVASRRRQR